MPVGGGGGEALGQGTMAASVPVAVASNQSAVPVSGTVTVSDNVDVDLALVGDAPLALGQTTMANSIPIAIASNQSALSVSIGAPPTSSPVAASTGGTTTQAAADISSSTVGANKVFTGVLTVTLSATQAAAVNAAGTVFANITWVPGAGGTAAPAASCIAQVTFAAGGPTGGAQSGTMSISVPVVLYAGTTSGKFQATVTSTGTITTLFFECLVNGTAQ